MLYVVSSDNLVLSTNAYSLKNKTMVYSALINMGYNPANLMYYDEVTYFTAYPSRKLPSEMEILTAKVDYVSMVVEGLVMANV